MTYLEIVNKVLRLSREDEITGVSETDDVYALLVCDFVNDAKRYVEEAHNWNSLRTEWAITTANGTASYPLTNAGKHAKIEYILGNKYEVRNAPLKVINREANINAGTGEPTKWATNGVDASNDVQIKFYPTPDAVYNFTVYGYEPQADLALDADVLTIPDQPVVYRALALALRERGEVGGQTAAEVFMLADQHLSDAIARDADMSSYDYIWYAH